MLDVGVLAHGFTHADLYFNQCDGPDGRHRDIRLRPQDLRPPKMFVLAPPIGPDSRPKPPNGPRRWIARRRGNWDAVWGDHAWDRVDRDPADVTAMVYEPPDFGYSDDWWAMTHRRASSVWGTNHRAQHAIRLPVMWSFDEHVSALHRDPPPASFDDRPLPLVAITSGTARLGGHRDRLAFLARLREAGVPIEIFGRGLPASLNARGPVSSKANVLRAARFALVIENSAEGDLYVSEKLWDAIACHTVPIYYGSGAADHMLPPGSFVRLPALDAHAVDTVRAAIADAALWRRCQESLRDAREAVLGPLRLVEWLHAVLRGEPIDPRLVPAQRPTPRPPRPAGRA